jgi:hypothetical protein
MARTGTNHGRRGRPSRLDDHAMSVILSLLLAKGSRLASPVSGTRLERVVKPCIHAGSRL